MDQVVYETLLSVADSDFTIRSQAEARLKELASAPGNIKNPLKLK